MGPIVPGRDSDRATHYPLTYLFYVQKVCHHLLKQLKLEGRYMVAMFLEVYLAYLISTQKVLF